MPENMTWWEAKRYAMAGVPVRRQVQFDPVKWFTYTTGLFHYHEEIDTLLAAPSPADGTVIIVTNTHFGVVEFLAHDWTTLPPYGPGNKPPDPAPQPPDPPELPPGLPEPEEPGNYPPKLPTVPIGNNGGTSGGAGGVNRPGGSVPTGGSSDSGTIIVTLPILPPGGDPPIVFPKPPKPAPPATPPSLTGEAHTTGPSVTATLSGIGDGQSWYVIAQDTTRGAGPWNLGLFLAPGDSHTVSAPGLEMYDVVRLTATCLHGPQTMHVPLPPIEVTATL